MKKVIIPIPALDFDPTESGVPWKILKQNKINVTFATPLGKPGLADGRMLTGNGLGIWKNLLKADVNGLTAYQEMTQSSEFQNPIAWNDINPSHFDAILLPGGHAPGMKEYLESQSLQQRIADFFSSDRLVGAICHGVVLTARSRNAKGQSVLQDHKVTALLKTQEMTAWALTCLWLKNY